MFIIPRVALLLVLALYCNPIASAQQSQSVVPTKFAATG
jgi:hypothetical protein